ncbi:hypothetical protein NFJ02_13g14030 [Pycnococcus provasolii]
MASSQSQSQSQSSVQASQSQSRVHLLKQQGNVAYANFDFLAAITLYLDALRCINDGDNTSSSVEMTHILHSNLAASYLHVDMCMLSLEHAKKAKKLKPTWPKAHVRVVDALEALHDFTGALDAAKRGLQKCRDGGVPENELGALRDARSRIKERIKTKRTDPTLEYFENASYRGDIDIDDTPIVRENETTGGRESRSYVNLNMIQKAAVECNAELVELAARLGGAIDYPSLDLTKLPPEARNTNGMLAPPGATALIIACSLRVFTKKMVDEQHGLRGVPRHLAVSTRDTHAKCLRVVEVLLHLGASPTAKARGEGRGDPRIQFIQRDKNCYEIARAAGDDKLLELLEKFSQNCDRPERWCRCGSHKPFSKCHGANLTDTQRYDRKDGTRRIDGSVHSDNGELPAMRYSPFAPCVCGKSDSTSKRPTYFHCCWEKDDKWMKDDTGRLYGKQVIQAGSQMLQDGFLHMHSLQEALGVADGPMFQKHDPVTQLPTGQPMDMTDIVDQNQMMCSMYRESGWSFLTAMLGEEEGSRMLAKAGMLSRDPDVYADVIEKMSEQLGPGQVFQWRDDMHWQLPKAEMRTRVDQWNAALAEVAREKQLSQDVVQRNAASMAAPCANPICTVLSKKVKSCGKCGRVAYCSRDCQIQHWKEGGHKAQCIPR